MEKNIKETHTGYRVTLCVNRKRIGATFNFSQYESKQDTLEAALRFRDTRKMLKRNPITGRKYIYESFTASRYGGFNFYLQAKVKGKLLKSIFICRVADKSKLTLSAKRKTNKYKDTLKTLSNLVRKHNNADKIKT